MRKNKIGNNLRIMFIAPKVIYLMLEKEIEGEALNLNFLLKTVIKGVEGCWMLINFINLKLEE